MLLLPPALLHFTALSSVLIGCWKVVGSKSEVVGTDSGALKTRALGTGPLLEVVRSDSENEGGRVVERTLSLLRYVQLQDEEREKNDAEETGLRCFCDTSDCGKTSSCVTSGNCYTQILVLNDGSPPVTRGCIHGETPLLCENRRPKNSGPYPSLRCCKTHLCNHPPLNPAFETHQVTLQALEASWTQVPTVPHPTRHTADLAQGNSSTLAPEIRHFGPLPSERQESLRISPLARIWLISAAICVVLISAVGLFLLRRERRRARENRLERSATLEKADENGKLNAETGDISDRRRQDAAKEMKLLLTFPESSV